MTAKLTSPANRRTVTTPLRKRQRCGFAAALLERDERAVENAPFPARFSMVGRCGRPKGLPRAPRGLRTRNCPATSFAADRRVQPNMEHLTMCENHGPRDAATFDPFRAISDLEGALSILEGLVDAVEALSSAVDPHPAKRLNAVSAIIGPIVRELREANAACNELYVHLQGKHGSAA